MTIYSGFTIRKTHLKRFAILVSISVFACIYAVVHATENNSTSQGIALVCLILMVIFASLSDRHFYAKRIKMQIEKINGKLRIEINDPLLATPFIVEGNYTLHKQAFHEQNIKGAVMQTFYLTLLNEKNEPLVIFSASRFFFQERMHGFEPVDSASQSESKDELVTAPLIYSFVSLNEIDLILSRFESLKVEQV